MNRFFTLISLLLAIMLSCAAWADSSLSPTGITAGYKIAPQDALNVTVVNFTNLSTPAVVTPDGSISVPLVGNISVAGKTTDEAAILLTKKFSKYIIDPSVSVSLTSKHEERVVYTGYVTHPGIDSYRPMIHVLEGLGDVGGALPNGDLRKTVVTHADGSKVTLDLSHPEQAAGTASDVILQPDDVVYVPELRDEVSVVGEVSHPGSVIYKEDMTVLDALTLTGGVLDTGDLTAATLTHDGQVRKIDLDGMLHKADMTDNVKLSPGDQLNIPMGNRTYVFGDVGRPGFYLFKPGDRITDALHGVGGPDPAADLGKINVIRIDKVKNVADLHRINLNDFLLHGDITGNPVVQPGDYLYIPEKGAKFSISNVFQAISGIGVVNQTTRLINRGY